MTELRLSNNPSPAPLQSAASRTINWLLLMVGATVILVPIFGFSVWRHYSRKFGAIDHSADSVQVSTPRVIRQNSSGTLYEIRMDTTYRNSRSGVKLKLPGVWQSVNPAQITKPDLAHRFCILNSQSGMTAMFWPLFPDLLPSLDADANVLVTQFTRRAGFTLKRQTELEILGREAKQLEFGVPNGGWI